MDNIDKRVISVVAVHFNFDEFEITRDTSFVRDLDSDSLNAAELIIAIQDNFGVLIAAEDAERIHTVGDLIDFLQGNGPGAAGVTAKLPPRKPPPTS